MLERFFFGNLTKFISDQCCKRVEVLATGNAKRDQSLYLGIYNQISNYNNRTAYKSVFQVSTKSGKNGNEHLYIYFYNTPVRLSTCSLIGFCSQPCFNKTYRKQISACGLWAHNSASSLLASGIRTTNGVPLMRPSGFTPLGPLCGSLTTAHLL